MLTWIVQIVSLTNPIVFPAVKKMANEPSEYALRYGVTNEPSLGDNRSGLTPPDDLIHPYTSETLVQLDHILRYQASYLDSFKTRELDLANVLADYGTTKSDLQAIHPMLQRDKWETELPRHLAFYPVVAPGKAGFWVASNDDVWDVFLPCLALASKFIDHFHLWQWIGLLETPHFWVF